MGDPNQARDPHGRFSSGLQDSLEHQLRTERGHTAERAREIAIEVLTKRGHIDTEGRLTAAGREREAMGRAARRTDVHARMTGHKVEHVGYQHGRPFIK